MGLTCLLVGSLGGMGWLIWEIQRLRKEIRQLKQAYQARQTSLIQQRKHFSETREAVSLRLRDIGKSPPN